MLLVKTITMVNNNTLVFGNGGKDMFLLVTMFGLVITEGPTDVVLVTLSNVCLGYFSGNSASARVERRP